MRYIAGRRTEGSDVRRVVATMLVVAPLLAACGKAEEPLIPELKGRWDIISLHKLQEARGTVGSGTRQPNTSDNCAVSYVTFGKSRIVIRLLGLPVPVFHVIDTKVQGQRVILTGGMEANSKPSESGKLELLVRNGEVRFDDLIDERGRSIKYERIPDGHPLRSKGANTLGEAMQMFLDLKACKA
jgi:hypothetical protein